MPSIVASSIENLTEKKKKKLQLDIRGIDENTKDCLRGMLRFFMGDRNNIKVEIIDEEGTKPCGAIFLIKGTEEEFKEILRRRKSKNLNSQRKSYKQNFLWLLN